MSDTKNNKTNHEINKHIYKLIPPKRAHDTHAAVETLQAQLMWSCDLQPSINEYLHDKLIPICHNTNICKHYCLYEIEMYFTKIKILYLQLKVVSHILFGHRWHTRWVQVRNAIYFMLCPLMPWFYLYNDFMNSIQSTWQLLWLMSSCLFFQNILQYYTDMDIPAIQILVSVLVVASYASNKFPSSQNT